MKRAFKQLRISFDEGIVLHNVMWNPGTTQDSIADSLVLDTAAVARSLKVLEQKGYLTRVIDENNQRRKLVTLSPEGEALGKQIHTAMQAWDDEIFRESGADKTEAVIESLHFLQERASSVDISSVLKNWNENDTE